MLIERGQRGAALAVLERAAGERDADACFLLAAWRLSGQIIPRNLALARSFFRDASEAGHSDAEAIYIAFLANGTGGERDWGGALKRLGKQAEEHEDAARQLNVLREMALSGEGDPLDVPEGSVLSTSPHVTYFEKLFTPRECEYVLEAAASLYQPSNVLDPTTGRTIRNPIRTSDVATFPLASENPALHALNRRIARISRTRVEQGEPLQILRYQPGQEYRPHSDALPATGNQRILTVLVYLNDDYSGGETRFLASGLAVKAKQGDAILFRNADINGNPDPDAIHAGTPVLSGTKFVCSRWIRAHPLDLTRARGYSY